MKNKLINLALLVLGTLFGSGANFLVQIYLAKKLLVVDYGFYSSILNLVNLLTPMIGFGISGFMMKAYAEEGYNAKRWLENVYSALLFSALLVFIILQVTGFIKNNSLSYFYIYGFFFIYMLSVSYNSFMILYFQVQGKFKTFSLWQIVPNLTKLIFIFASVSLLGSSLHSIGIAYLLTGFFILIFSLNSLHKMKVGKIKLLDEPIFNKKDSVSSKMLMVASIPFGLNGIFYLIYFQSAILILSFIEGYESVAYFSLAMTLLTAFCLLPSIFFQKFLMPKIHYWAVHDKDKVYRFYKNNILFWLPIGLIAAALNFLFAKFFLVEFFGIKYAPAKDVFYLMSTVILIKYFNLNSGALMSTKNLISLKSKVMMYAALINIFLSIILITLFGIDGAVISILLVEIIISLLFIKILNESLGVLMNKKIKISGYYGMNNYGDDLFSLLSYKAISDKIPFAHCDLVGPNIVSHGGIDKLELNPLSKYYSNYNLTGKITRLAHYIHAAIDADYFMFCGGSLYSNTNRSVKDIIYPVNLNRYKFHAMGVSIGPFNNLEAEKRAIETLKHYEYIALRDKKSFERAKSFDLDAKIVLAGDLAGLGLKYFNNNQKKYIMRNKKVIGFSPCNLKDPDKSKKYINHFVSNIDSLKKELDFEVNIICLNSNSSNGDMSLCLLAERELKKTGVECKVINYKEIGVEKTWHIISSLDFFVSVRLHGAITAYLTQTPFFLYEYHEKCTEFLKYINAASYNEEDYVDDNIFLSEKIIFGFNIDSEIMKVADFYENSLINIDENPLIYNKV